MFLKKIYFGLFVGKVAEQSGHCGEIGNTGSFTGSYDCHCCVLAC